MICAGYCDKGYHACFPARTYLGELMTFPVTYHSLNLFQGGVLFASADQYDRVINATAVFSATVADPKAAIIPSFFYTSGMVSNLLC